MRIGIIGSGVVAQSLGAGFVKLGYETMLGTGFARDDWSSRAFKLLQ